MATSGSIDLLADRDALITEALEQLGVIAEGDSPNSNQLSSCARTLNYMVKAWQGRGLNLWAMERHYVFLQKNQREYALSGSTSDHVTASYIQTTVNGAASSGATTVTLDTTDIDGNTFSVSASDNIGIQLDSGTDVQWTTVSSFTSNVATLGAALTDDVADGATVYIYTSKANRPFKVIGPAVVRTKDFVDTPIEIIARQDYEDLSQKDTTGRINQIFYDPQVGTGTLFVWPETDDETDFLVIWVTRTLEDFDAATDDADFPQEWFLALALSLALRLAPKFGVSSESFNQIASLAQQALFDAESSDTEQGMSFVPDERSQRG